ncbi:uncharacterized protein LOC106657706 isoform X1 [Trichogramma pretiosum]|uniref:uncharacterized protein LOC106657706 isoform X1 n=2 Tax=Trichogramma pretiosum TaxID=7493 RepID=UPI0006C99776|nr:uncharacterized protein LOC106657706 isoform X1 [Trichogramma pretiosum]
MACIVYIRYNRKPLLIITMSIEQVTKAFQHSLVLDDFDDDEEIYLMEVPKTFDPKLLKGQTLRFGEKSKLKIGEDKYYATQKENKSNMTFILSTGKEENEYMAVNIKPAGTLNIRRKLPNPGKEVVPTEVSNSVPFPKEIKTRHPFFGVQAGTSYINIKTERNS